MPYAVAAKNAMLDHLASLIGFVSAHTASPGSTGTNEVTGGSPAYARKAITWGSASGGELAASNQPVLDIPAATSVTHVGFWSAATSGTYYGYIDADDEAFTNQGTYTINSCTLDLNATASA